MPLVSGAENYSAQNVTVDGLEAIRLVDAKHGVQATIFPSFGNNVCELRVKGKNILWTPFNSVAEARAKPLQIANPLLAPWANRIDRDEYFINGKRYLLNSGR